MTFNLLFVLYFHSKGSSQEGEIATYERAFHMDYDNYDWHRHAVKVVEERFTDSLEEGKMEIRNS